MFHPNMLQNLLPFLVQKTTMGKNCIFNRTHHLKAMCDKNSTHLLRTLCGIEFFLNNMVCLDYKKNAQ